MKTFYWIFSLLLFGILISVGCTAGAAEPTVTAVAVVTASTRVVETAVIPPSPTATSSPTTTPSPTATPLPTATPSPTITPSPSPTATPAIVYPTKEIFIQWGGNYGSDGFDITDFYYGRETPSMVIYADGQMLIKDGGRRTTTFFETTLTSAEMCALRDEIAATGFLEPHDEEAYYTQRRNGNEGQGNIVVQVEDVLYYFDATGVSYLTADLYAGLNIVRNFQSNHPTDTLYRPETLIFLGSEANLEWLTLYGYNDQPVAWPTAFPPLSEVWVDTTQDQFTITGESVPFIYDWFDNTLTERIVQWGDMNYYIIVRPLLPDETPDAFSNYPYPPTDYISTLDCTE